MYFLGIDPGKSGGLALLPECGAIPTMVARMPDTLQGLWHMLNVTVAEKAAEFESDRDKFRPLAGIHCALEEVHSMPKQGVKSTFTFGKGFGHLEMGLMAARISHELVKPERWQKELGIPKVKKASKKERKQRLLETAQRRWPEEHITLATADALLIAEWLRRRTIGP